MSDALERAAKALEPYLERGAEREIASAALLAFLDPEDEGLQFGICAGIGFVTDGGDYSRGARDQARRAIQQMRLIVHDQALLAGASDDKGGSVG